MDDQKLKDFFGFDESDLQANRSGNFSEKQKNDILKDIKRFEKNRTRVPWAKNKNGYDRP
jgi:hypothetical protein